MCNYQNYSLEIARLGAPDQCVCFTDPNTGAAIASVTITFTMAQDTPPSSPPRSVTSVSYGTLPSGYPTPTTTTNTITFYDPGTATDDIDVTVSYTPEFPSPPGVLFEPSTTLKVMPRKTCPN